MTEIPFQAIPPQYPGMGSYGAGYEQGQRIHANQLRNVTAEDQMQQVAQFRKHAALVRAMQIGQDSPEMWDAAMQRASEAGSEEAQGFVGKWSPFGAQRLLQSYQQAMGPLDAGGDASGGGGQPMASAPSAGAPRSQQFEPHVEDAFSQMTPQARQKMAGNLDHILSRLDGVNSKEAAHTLVQDLGQKGILPEGVADQYAQAIDDDAGGQNPYAWVEKVRRFKAEAQAARNRLSPYTSVEQFGAQVPGPGAKYDTVNPTESTGPGFWKTEPAGAPTWNPITGGAGAPGSGDGVPFLKSDQAIYKVAMDSQAVFDKAVMPHVVSKEKLGNILALDPDKATGTDQIMAVYSFIKGLDPTSVVKQDEIALFSSAKSLFERLAGQFEGAAEGTIMTPSVLRKLQDTAQTMLSAVERGYREQEQSQVKAMRRYMKFGLDLDLAVPDRWVKTPMRFKPGAPGVPPPGAPPPPAYLDDEYDGSVRPSRTIR